jgi:hypothetical protein
MRGGGRDPLVDELLRFDREMCPDLAIDIVVGSSSG